MRRICACALDLHGLLSPACIIIFHPSPPRLIYALHNERFWFFCPRLYAASRPPIHIHIVLKKKTSPSVRLMSLLRVLSSRSPSSRPHPTPSMTSLLLNQIRSPSSSSHIISVSGRPRRVVSLSCLELDLPPPAHPPGCPPLAWLPLRSPAATRPIPL